LTIIGRRRRRRRRRREEEERGRRGLFWHMLDAPAIVSTRVRKVNTPIYHHHHHYHHHPPRFVYL